jgi:O-antigen/teichoic acid export membrane protein
MINKLFRTKLRRDTTESVITGFAGQAVLIISGILVARLLGAEGRGYLAMLVLFPILLTQIGLCGVPQALTYYVTQRPDSSKALLRNVTPVLLIQCLGLTVLQGLIVMLYTVGKSTDVSQAGYASLIVVPGIIIHEYGLALLQGIGKFRIFNIQRLMPALLYALSIVFVFLSDSSSLLVVVIVWSSIYILVGVSTFLLAWRELVEGSSVDKKINTISIRRILSFGLKGMIGWTEPLESFRLDQLICGLLLTPSALGLYVVAQAFTNLPRFLAQSVGFIAYPAVSTGKEDPFMKHKIRRFTYYTAAVNTVIVIALVILMPFLITFLFGQEFQASVTIAQILLVGALFASIRRILVEISRGLGRPEISTYASLSLYPWLIIATPLMINNYAIEGLAISVMLGQMISLIVAIVLSRRIRDYVQ